MTETRFFMYRFGPRIDESIAYGDSNDVISTTLDYETDSLQTFFAYQTSFEGVDKKQYTVTTEEVGEKTDETSYLKENKTEDSKRWSAPDILRKEKVTVEFEESSDELSSVTIYKSLDEKDYYDTGTMKRKTLKTEFATSDKDYSPGRQESRTTDYKMRDVKTYFEEGSDKTSDVLTTIETDKK